MVGVWVCMGVGVGVLFAECSDHLHNGVEHYSSCTKTSFSSFSIHICRQGGFVQMWRFLQVSEAWNRLLQVRGSKNTMTLQKGPIMLNHHDLTETP